jgi:hypothetical protein
MTMGMDAVVLSRRIAATTSMPLSRGIIRSVSTNDGIGSSWTRASA